jgi:hypothetical protein
MSYTELLEKNFTEENRNTKTANYVDYVKSNMDFNFKFLRLERNINRHNFYFGCEDTSEEILICSLSPTDDNLEKLKTILSLLKM